MTDAASRRRSWPAISEDTVFFWEGATGGELRIQQCTVCGTLTHPPQAACAACRSFELGYVVASGRGEVYSHVTFHRPLSAPFTEPYNVSVVELEEGVRMVSQVVDVAVDDVHIGMAVTVVFVEVEPGLVLPLFRPLALPMEC